MRKIVLTVVVLISFIGCTLVPGVLASATVADTGATVLNITDTILKIIDKLQGRHKPMTLLTTGAAGFCGGAPCDSPRALRQTGVVPIMLNDPDPSVKVYGAFGIDCATRQVAGDLDFKYDGKTVYVKAITPKAGLSDYTIAILYLKAPAK